MKPYQAVLFDLDGTLIDTAPEFVTVVNRMLQSEGKPAISSERIREQVSNGAKALVELAWNISDDHPDYPRQRQSLLDEYLSTIGCNTALFDGFEETLLWCESQAIPWGIVTNKPRIFSEALLESLKLDQRCSVLVCPDDVTHTKPNAEPILKACSQINVESTQTLYVGDHLRDVEAGRNAGCTTMAVSFGYITDRAIAESWNADYLIDSPIELLAHLKSNNHAA